VRRTISVRTSTGAAACVAGGDVSAVVFWPLPEASATAPRPPRPASVTAVAMVVRVTRIRYDLLD
jgi:hypothetical protein